MAPPCGCRRATSTTPSTSPLGYLSSAYDERGRRSVVSLLGRETDRRLWPAGRLDVESEGLMLLTDDGAWANRVLHPRYGIEREYAALVESMPGRATLHAPAGGGRARRRAWRDCSRRAPRRRRERSDARRGSGAAGCGCGSGRAASARCDGSSRPSTSACCAWSAAASDHSGSTGFSSGSGAASSRRPWRRWPARDRASPPGATLTVAIDGPSGAGKSTVGYALAQRIGANFVDTGLMYRALTLAALEAGVDVEDGKRAGARWRIGPAST